MTIDDLKEQKLILFECISGSKAYDLNTGKSDTDIKGVFYLPKEQFYSTEYIAQISDEKNDVVYYELGRFVELLIKNNPNILELLATPDDCILYKHPIMDALKIEMFLSKLCKETFAGYALTQIRKAKGLNKKIINPFPEERKSLLDFCYVVEDASSISLSEWLNKKNFSQEKCGLSSVTHTKGLYALFYDDMESLKYKGIVSSEDANEVSLSSIPKGEKPEAHMFCNQEAYSSYCKEYRSYWDWVKKRNEERYLTNVSHGKDYDTKNMMHTVRLLQVAEEIATQNKINVTRTNRDELLSIKFGEFEYDALLEMADDIMQRTAMAFGKSKLPEEPDKNKIEKTLVAMRMELYQ
jgi:predicted nucleotidyltransferase